MAKNIEKGHSERRQGIKTIDVGCSAKMIILKGVRSCMIVSNLMTIREISAKAAVDENDTKQRELKWGHPLKGVAVTMFVAPIDG